MVTAFGANPDGEVTILRVWEQAEISGKLAEDLPKDSKVTKAKSVNFRGERTEKELIIQDN